MPINEWPEDDRPREKLLAKGPSSLSDAELLAIFLRTGTRGKSAVDLARILLEKFGSLVGLIGASREAFCAVQGLGGAKYAQLQAATELTRRALVAEMKSGINLSSPTAARDYLRLSIQNRQVEVFVGLFLDAQNRVIAVEELFSGTLTQTSVFPREVVRRALHHNAAGVIFVHFVARHKMHVMFPESFCAQSSERFVRETGFFGRRHITIVASDGRVSPAELDGWLSEHKRPAPTKAVGAGKAG
ncbi:MAG TPA: DNA repair protein RadC [Burkholderiales bacterium]|nr:DNA repair protein RadC [Burkholderiales bacterium]